MVSENEFESLPSLSFECVRFFFHKFLEICEDSCMVHVIDTGAKLTGCYSENRFLYEQQETKPVRL